MDKDTALKLLQDNGAVLKGHFLLTSGRHSDTYMQCAKLFTDAALSQRIVEELAKKLNGIKADYVISPAVGGVLFGYELSRALNTKNIFAERENDAMTLRRGFTLNPEQKVIVAEDAVTTGGSVKEVIELVKSMGAQVLAVAAIVDRSNGAVDFGVPFIPLLSLNVVSYAAQDCPLCKDGSKPVKPGSRRI